MRSLQQMRTNYSDILLLIKLVMTIFEVTKSTDDKNKQNDVFTPVKINRKQWCVRLKEFRRRIRGKCLQVHLMKMFKRTQWQINACSWVNEFARKVRLLFSPRLTRQAMRKTLFRNACTKALGIWDKNCTQFGTLRVKMPNPLSVGLTTSHYFTAKHDSSLL